MGKINIIVATHGRFGEELVKSAEMIAGKMENVQNLSLLPSMSLEEFMAEADAMLAKTEKPLIVLVDLFGGTPCNVMTALSRKYNYDVVTGVNIGMLIELYVSTLSMADEEIDTDQLAENCLATLQETGVHTNKQL